MWSRGGVEQGGRDAECSAGGGRRDQVKTRASWQILYSKACALAGRAFIAKHVPSHAISLCMHLLLSTCACIHIMERALEERGKERAGSMNGIEACKEHKRRDGEGVEDRVHCAHHRVALARVGRAAVNARRSSQGESNQAEARIERTGSSCASQFDVSCVSCVHSRRTARCVERSAHTCMYAALYAHTCTPRCRELHCAAHVPRPGEVCACVCVCACACVVCACVCVCVCVLG